MIKIAFSLIHLIGALITLTVGGNDIMMWALIIIANIWAANAETKRDAR